MKIMESINELSQVDNSTSFNETRSENLTILDVDQSFPIITKSLGCPESGSTPAFDANITITADVKAKLDGDIGFIVVGSIVPPHIDDLAFTSSELVPSSIRRWSVTVINFST